MGLGTTGVVTGDLDVGDCDLEVGDLDVME